MPSLTIRPIDDPQADYVSIAGEALLAYDREPWQLYVERIGKENLRGVYAENELLGGMAFYRMSQWFGGKPIDCAGFSGVAISPAHRGTKACDTMLRSVLQELHDEGLPIASLYASTQHLYRNVGFEHAGTQIQYSIPIQSVRNSDRSCPIHRFETPPLDKLNQVAEIRAAATNGNLTRTEGLWQRLLNPYDGKGSITYLFGDLESPEGFAILRPGTRDCGVPQALHSTDVAAVTPRALQRLLTLVRDHRSMCDRFTWFGGPNDPLHFAASEQFVKVEHFMRWMLRIVNLPAAFEARGYADDITGQLNLEIEDETLPSNSGHWAVNVAKGKAVVTRCDSSAPRLKMNVRVLAPLFTGLYTPSELAGMGLLEGNDQQQRLAAQIFAGSPPWVVELF